LALRPAEELVGAFKALASQLLDSILFFTIAFYGTVPNESLIQIIIGGALVKILIGILSTPFLYWSYPAPKQFWT